MWSLFVAPETDAHDVDHAVVEIAWTPFVHLEGVFDGVGDHVVTISILGGVGCRVSGNEVGCFQPAWGIRELGVGAWDIDGAGLGGVGVSLFQEDLDVAVFCVLE